MTVEQGRADQLALAVLERLVCRYVEPVVGVPVWTPGVEELARELIAEAGIPARPVTPLEVARQVGLVGRRRRRRIGKAA